MRLTDAGGRRHLGHARQLLTDVIEGTEALVGGRNLRAKGAIVCNISGWFKIHLIPGTWLEEIRRALQLLPHNVH